MTIERFEITLKAGKGDVFKLSGSECRMQRNKVILIFHDNDNKRTKFTIPMSNISYIKEILEVNGGKL